MVAIENGKRSALNALADGRGRGDTDLGLDRSSNINISRGGAVQVLEEANATRIGEFGTL